jgi:lipopolysaccharide/colanic/teichoic acid biosynthesis glycosyltransferase
MKDPGFVDAQLPFDARVNASSWCNSGIKRAWDFFWSAFLLILLAPVLLATTVAVKLSSPGPVLFRQRRPGKGGREFTIYKFRTMVVNRQKAGPVLTKALDPRVTWLGRYLRKWKLDELPQLFNVLCGEMSFVGPRPQPTILWKEPSIKDDAALVLSVRPGITSTATLAFRNEEEVLAPIAYDRVEEVYLRTLMPLKLKMEVQYLGAASFRSDLKILMQTMGRIFRRRDQDDELLKRCLPDLTVSPVSRIGSPAKSQGSWTPAELPALSLLSEFRDVRRIAGSASAEENAGT